jgi:multicomponent Na+:H+ antiporter subunit E
VPPRRRRPWPPWRPIHLLRLAVHFVRELVVATGLVAWEVITPRNRINQGIVCIPMRASSPGLVTLVANMITLTPGTLTIELRSNPTRLYVHILHLRSVEEVRHQVRHLEGLAMAAFERESDS